jgi:hypothetical protein
MKMTVGPTESLVKPVLRYQITGPTFNPPNWLSDDLRCHWNQELFNKYFIISTDERKINEALEKLTSEHRPVVQIFIVFVEIVKNNFHILRNNDFLRRQFEGKFNKQRLLYCSGWIQDMVV